MAYIVAAMLITATGHHSMQSSKGARNPCVSARTEGSVCLALLSMTTVMLLLLL